MHRLKLQFDSLISEALGHEHYGLIRLALKGRSQESRRLCCTNTCVKELSQWEEPKIPLYSNATAQS